MRKDKLFRYSGRVHVYNWFENSLTNK